MRRSFKQTFYGGVLFGMLALPALSAEAGTWTVNVENDRIANTDRHYTNGVRLGWVSEPEDGNNLPEVRDTLQTLYPLAEVRGGRLGLELGHNMYTPADTEARTLISDDRPYAGWLYGSASLYAETGKGIGEHFTETLDKVALEVGIVGPAALGKQVQNEYHKLIGVATSKGWENQLDNEPGVNLIGERKWRHKALRFAGFEADAIPHVGASLGNVYTHLNGGVTLRIGQELYVDYGPPLIRPSLSGFGAINPAEKFSWYAFAGVDGRWVVQNIFLDGNTFTDSHSVDKKNLVGDFVAGVSMTYRNVRIAFTHVMRTREFDTQTKTDRFGAVSLSFRF
ncbi:lipid A deacylase LpxR family protein [Thalassospiraceae bacterium LMO-JJ14]|nr:lipid A deacylase LpxR family protein [Thalassospiraceae bacterium LMO-JJ14]